VTYLEQLKADREAITRMLQAQQKYPLPSGEGRVNASGSFGVHTTSKIYIQILTDALSALNSLIQFLEKER